MTYLLQLYIRVHVQHVPGVYRVCSMAAIYYVHVQLYVHVHVHGPGLAVYIELVQWQLYILVFSATKPLKLLLRDVNF